MLVGRTLAGVSAALGYRRTAAAARGQPASPCGSGSLQVVNQIAPADRRAEVVSSYLIACYVGNSLPVIGVGVIATMIDPLTASGALAVTVTALALAALATGVKTASRDGS